jgi:hypothetical protein
MKIASSQLSETKSKIDEIFGIFGDGMMISENTAKRLLRSRSNEDITNFSRFVESLRTTKITNKSSNLKIKMALDLADKLGMKYNMDKIVMKIFGGDKVQWDGNISKFGSSDWEGIVHEVCHWQVAPQSHRFTPDYGLGASVSGDKSVDDIRARRPEQDPALDEDMAVLMGAMWLREWGFAPYQPWVSEFVFGNWENVYQNLVGVGLITTDFRPQLVARLKENSRRRR